MPTVIGHLVSVTTDTYYRLLEAYYSMMEKTVDLFLRTNRK